MCNERDYLRPQAHNYEQQAQIAEEERCKFCDGMGISRQWHSQTGQGDYKECEWCGSSGKDYKTIRAKRSSLLLSEETEAAIERAAKYQGRRQDIWSWARKLADDVKDLND
jgi:hypothetical protein